MVLNDAWQMGLIHYGQNIIRSLHSIRNESRILNDKNLVLRIRDNSGLNRRIKYQIQDEEAAVSYLILRYLHCSKTLELHHCI